MSARHPFNRTGVRCCATYLNILNVYGRKNSNGYEWDERRSISITEGFREASPTIELRFEYSWTPDE